MKQAIIDISAFGVSLSVAEYDGENLSVLYREKTPVSMLSYLEKGKLSELGIFKLISCVAKLIEVSGAYNPQSVSVIATSALRNIDNLDNVISQVRDALGVEVVPLRLTQEGECDARANFMYKHLDSPVIIDIGGGSVEIAPINDGEILTYDIGGVHIHKKFVSDIQPNEDELKDIKKHIKKKFDKNISKLGYKSVVLCGSVNRAIYDTYADFYNIKKSSEKIMQVKKLKKLQQALTSPATRSALILKSAPEKASTLLISLILLRHFLKQIDKVEECRVSVYGVKEGWFLGPKGI